VALISLATGVVRDLATGPYVGKETGETALFRMLWDRLSRPLWLLYHFHEVKLADGN
jgi:hypothetical protein